jgi:hypothetical protein
LLLGRETVNAFDTIVVTGVEQAFLVCATVDGWAPIAATYQTAHFCRADALG